MTEWCDTKIELPIEGEDVLLVWIDDVYIGHMSRRYQCWYLDGHVGATDIGGNGPQVTHWMPLPDPPEEEV